MLKLRKKLYKIRSTCKKHGQPPMALRTVSEKVLQLEILLQKT